MSKNIIIQEGGIGKQMTVDKLKTNLASGGTCLWVPEDENQLGTKHITENGTYNASDDGYSGYSQVTVSGIGTATGTGPDGEEHSYSEDGEGGITDTVLPSSISVVTPPTVTTYTDGATIDFTGILVKAYLKSGDLWTDSAHPDGVIPINELIFPVTVADAEEVEDRTATSDLETDPASPIKYGSGVQYELKGTGGDQRPYTTTTTYSGGTAVVVQGTDSPGNLRIILAGKTNGTVTINQKTVNDDTGEISSDVTTTASMYKSYTYQGKTAYWYYISSSVFSNVRIISPSPEHLNTNRNVTDDTIAWTILYGTMSGGFQSIPVQWTRSNGDTLGTSFNITVT